MQPFCVAVVDVFGAPQVHNLKENGDQVIVTNDTRQVINVINNTTLVTNVTIL